MPEKIPDKYARREVIILALVIAICLAWEAASRTFQIPEEILPGPARIAGEIWLEHVRLETNAAITAYEIIVGLLIALAIAVPSCLAGAGTPMAENVLKPSLAFLQNAPIVLLAPLFFIWLGYGASAKLCFSAVLCLIAVTSSILAGLKELPQDILDLAELAGTPRRRIIAKILLPASMCHILGGMRTGAMTALLGCIIAEYVEAEKGLGFVIVAATSRLDTPLVCAAFVVLMVLAGLIHLSIAMLERWLTPYSTKTTGWQDLRPRQM